MKKQNLRRIIIAGLIATGILTIAPVSAKAEYTPNTTSLWHAEGTSLIMILKLINEKLSHFDNNITSPSEVVNNNSDSTNIFDQSIEQAVSEAIKAEMKSVIIWEK